MGILYHGGCIGCPQHINSNQRECSGCQYHDANWELPNLSKETKKVKSHNSIRNILWDWLNMKLY